MMICFAHFTLGAFVGSAATVLLWALCAMAGQTDRQMEREEEGEGL